MLAMGLTLHAAYLSAHGQPGPPLPLGDLRVLVDLRFAFGGVLGTAVQSLAMGMGCVLLFLLLKLLLRRDTLAAAALGLILIGLQRLAYPAGSVWADVTMTAITWGSLFVLLRSFGLLAVVAGFFLSDVLRGTPLTLDLGSWAAGPTIVVGLTVFALAGFAFRLALGDRLRLVPEGRSSSSP
jgi:hypothetical protein